MAETISVLARLRRTRGVDLLPDSAIVQLLGSLGIVWRKRLLTPAVTVRLFLMQVLFANTSITHLRQLSGIDFAPASYCRARMRLSLRLLRSLLRWTTAQAQAATRQIGPRIMVVDCSSFSMPDCAALRKQFGLPRGPGCKAGVSYPIAKVMALLDLGSGCFTRLIPGPLYRHEASGVIRLHRQLRKGDILLGDRAFCSVVHVMLLALRQVDACFRLHQRRHSVRGGVERWRRPGQRPAWMPPAQFAALPKWIEVRIVRYTIKRNGYRTKHVAIAYNLIWLAMLKFAQGRGHSVDRVSFIDAMRYLAMRMLGLIGVANLRLNPHRPGRRQLRVIRRRIKEYDLLMEPRQARMAREYQG